MADHLITIVEAVIIKFKLFLKFLFIYYLLICLHCWIVFSRSRLCELETVRQRLEIVLILTVISGFLKSVLYKKLFKVCLAFIFLTDCDALDDRINMEWVLFITHKL